jgi:hypothetical protein
VIVGGTNYYIESLLWKVLVGEDESSVGVIKQVKSTSNADDTCSDSVDIGGTVKEHGGDRIDVTCHKEVLDKCSGPKFQKRVRDFDTEIVSTKYKKLQSGDGLNAFSSRCQVNIHSQQSQTQAEEEVDCVCERPFLDSTECQKNLDHSGADVTQAHGTAFSQSVCTDSEEDTGLGLHGPKPIITEFQSDIFCDNDVNETQTKVCGEIVGVYRHEKMNTVKEFGQDKSMMHGAHLSPVSGDVKMCYKTEGLMQMGSPSNEEVVCLDNKRQIIKADSELVYERDRRRLHEARSQEDMESKNQTVQGGVVDLLDEAALERVPSSHLYEKLQEVDPDMAQGLHPNNRRKIIR